MTRRTRIRSPSAHRRRAPVRSDHEETDREEGVDAERSECRRAERAHRERRGPEEQRLQQPTQRVREHLQHSQHLHNSLVAVDELV